MIEVSALERGSGAYSPAVAVEVQEPDLGKGITLGSYVTVFGHVSILTPPLAGSTPQEQLPVRLFPCVKVPS